MSEKSSNLRERMVSMADEKSKVLTISLVGLDDTDENLIDQNQRAKISLVSRRLLNFLAIFVSVDVFQPNLKGENDPFVRLEQDKPHWLHRCWRKLYRPICIYLVVRPLVTFSLRFLIHQLGSDERQSRLLHQLRWLLDIYGDPACSVPRLSPFIYLITPVSISVLNIAIPYHLHNINLFDCSIMRFLLDPKREIRRVDRSVCEKLNYALEGVEEQRKKLSSALGIYPKFHALYLRRTNFDDVEHIQATLVRLMAQSNLLKNLRRNLRTMRPSTFSADWLQCYHRIFLALYFIAAGSCVWIYTGITVVVVHILWQDRCEQWTFMQQQLQPNLTHPSDCSFITLILPSEFQRLVETCISYEVFVLLSFAFYMSLMTLMVFNQVDVTNSTRKNLVRLSGELRQLSRQVEQTRLARNERNDASASSVDRLDATMCKNIIGLWTYEVESRRNARQLSTLMSFFIGLMAVLILSSFGAFLPAISASSVGCNKELFIVKEANSTLVSQADILASIITMLIWVGANVMMLVCAIIPSRVMRMKRLVVTILAQTIQVNQSKRFSLPSRKSATLETRRSRKPDDAKQQMDTNNPLILLWRKIVLSQTFVSDDHSVNVFNFKLTYKKVLELNFYVIALMSLLSNRR